MIAMGSLLNRWRTPTSELVRSGPCMSWSFNDTPLYSCTTVEYNSYLACLVRVINSIVNKVPYLPGCCRKSFFGNLLGVTFVKDVVDEGFVISKVTFFSQKLSLLPHSAPYGLFLVVRHLHFRLTKWGWDLVVTIDAFGIFFNYFQKIAYLLGSELERRDLDLRDR